MRKITVITHAPARTLGDPTLVSEFLANLLRENSDVEVTLLVEKVNLPGHIHAIEGVLLKHDRLDVRYLKGSFKDSNLNVDYSDELFENTDGIIVYPTIALLNREERAKLQKLREQKPVLYITNYNFQQQADYDKANQVYNESHPRSPLETYDSLVHQGHVLETGIGLRLLGMNLPIVNEANPSPVDSATLKSLMGLAQNEELDVDVIDSYKKSSELYFGYYNNIPSEAKDNKSKAKSFAKLCVLDSITKNGAGKNIDIIMPLVDDPTNSTCTWNDLRQELGEHVTLEYWVKDPETNQLVLKNSAGTGQPTVRIINAFPLAHNTMKFMYQHSNPITLITGNSSLGESIAYNKIFLYQTMSWHTKLYADLLSVVKVCFDTEHPYRKYHEIIADDQDKKEDRLAELWHQYQPELMAGAKHFQDYIRANFNLRNKLTHEVLAKIPDSPPERDTKSKMNANESVQDYIDQFKTKYKAYKEGDQSTTDLTTLNNLLMVAFIQQDSATAKKLITAGADPNYVRKIGEVDYNPLFFCLYAYPNARMLELLDQQKAFNAVAGLQVIRKSVAKPFSKLIGDDTHMPNHRVLDIFIQSALRQHVQPESIMDTTELEDIESLNDIHFLEIMYRTKLLKPPIQANFDLTKWEMFSTQFRAFIFTKETWPQVLVDDNIPAKERLNLLEEGIFRFKSDIDYLKGTLNNPDDPIILKLMSEFPFDASKPSDSKGNLKAKKLHGLAQKILEPTEFDKYLRLVNDKVNEKHWIDAFLSTDTEAMQALRQLPQFSTPHYGPYHKLFDKLVAIKNEISSNEITPENTSPIKFYFDPEENALVLQAGQYDGEEYTVFYDLKKYTTIIEKYLRKLNLTDDEVQTVLDRVAEIDSENFDVAQIAIDEKMLTRMVKTPEISKRVTLATGFQLQKDKLQTESDKENIDLNPRIHTESTKRK